MLSKFIDRGNPNYLSLMTIPSSERIVAMVEKDRSFVHKIIAAQIDYAMQYFNLRYGLTTPQIFLLVDEILEDSESDNLSIQDVYLFLIQLGTGKMGKIYDRLDIPTFMELFENYRQARHEAYVNLKYEQECQFKTLGDSERTTIDTEKELHKTALKEHLKNLK